MHILLGLLLILLLAGAILGPSYWARRTFRRYAVERDDIPGTGAELALHLIKRFELPVTVEKLESDDGSGEGSAGDHYDPISHTVRLSAANHDGRSLTAVAVAAHEVGHAIQHQRREAAFLWRLRLTIIANGAQKLGAIALIAMPIIALISRHPPSGLLIGAIGFLSMGGAALVHLITLPVERDSSFGNDLPILKQGGYLKPGDEKAVHKILKAAALTYFAASLAALLNLGRWLQVLRR